MTGEGKMRKRKIVTLRDIAAKTGYTVNTVSHALTGKTDISPQTVEYIKNVAEEMGYINDSIASSMRTGRTGTIAVILADITNPLFAIIVHTVEQLANSVGYSVFILNTNESREFELKAIKTALGKKVDGIIICPCPDCADNLDFLRKTGCPYVLVGRKCPGHRSVTPDDVKCGRLAAEFLAGLGCRRIAFVNGQLTLSCSVERLIGYREGLREAGINYDDELVIESKTQTGAAGTVLDKLAQTDYDGIFAFSDLIAYELINGCGSDGKTIRADVPMISVDHISEKLPYLKQINTIGPSGKSMADIAFEIIMSLIDELPLDFPVETVIDVKTYPA